MCVQFDYFLVVFGLRNWEWDLYTHPSLSAVKWFQKNRAPSDTALSESDTKASVQELESTV
jgi:hypothetical protein